MRRTFPSSFRALCHYAHILGISRILANFRAMGYSEEDVSSIKYESIVNQSRELNDRSKNSCCTNFPFRSIDLPSPVWKRLQPILEPKIIAHRKDRLFKQRKKIFIPLYQSYNRTLPPRSWLSLPRDDVVLRFPTFDVIVNAPHDVEVTVASFNDAMDALPVLIDRWMEERKKGLRAQLTSLNLPTSSADIATSGTAAPFSGPSSSDSSLSDSLDLATAVFICPRRTLCCKNVPPWGDHTTGIRFYSYHNPDKADPLAVRDKFPNPFFGWDDAGLHHTCEVREGWMRELKDCGELRVDERGIRAVKELIGILGMSGATTVQEMDARNACFFCDGNGRYESGCVIESRSGARAVYTWRSAVSILFMIPVPSSRSQRRMLFRSRMQCQSRMTIFRPSRF